MMDGEWRGWWEGWWGEGWKEVMDDDNDKKKKIE